MYGSVPTEATVVVTHPALTDPDAWDRYMELRTQRAKDWDLALRLMDEEELGLYPRYRVICDCGWKGYRVDLVAEHFPGQFGVGVSVRPCPKCKRRTVVPAGRVPHPDRIVEDLQRYVFGEEVA